MFSGSSEKERLERKNPENEGDVEEDREIALRKWIEMAEELEVTDEEIDALKEKISQIRLSRPAE